MRVFGCVFVAVSFWSFCVGTQILRCSFLVPQKRPNNCSSSASMHGCLGKPSQNIFYKKIRRMKNPGNLEMPEEKNRRTTRQVLGTPWEKPLETPPGKNQQTRGVRPTRSSTDCLRVGPSECGVLWSLFLLLVLFFW